MKKIALIMDGWKRWFTFAWPAGILQRIRQTGEEVSLYIFNSSGGWSCDEEDRKSTRLNSSHLEQSRMPSSA